MSLLYICVASMFFLFASLSSSSCPPKQPPRRLPCDNSTEIRPPFFESNQTIPGCESGIMVKCTPTGPRIHLAQFENIWFYLGNISYASKKVTVRDPSLEQTLQSSSCGSLLLSFPTLFHDFDYEYFLSFSINITSFCESRNLSSQILILGKEYTLNYSAATDEHLPRNCYSKTPNASFEWTFSFHDYDGNVSLLSAQYSNEFLSQPGCLTYSKVGGDSGSKGKAEQRESTGKKSHSAIKAILIVSVAAGASIIIFTCLIFNLKLQRCKSRAEYSFSRKHGPQRNIEMLLEKCGSIAPKRYKYSEVKKITHSFQDTLGKGGFGTVYKGSLKDGRLVAIKILHNSASHGDEFLNEVISIGRTSHVNVVSLLGFCIEGSKHALIYEYMSNGSLDNYIYSENSRIVLGWEKLYEIAIGTARGLEYLHRGCNAHIVHFDIKPQNILLDEDFNPKIADFGLAKLCPPKESILSLAEMRGTIGFIAPEVFSRNFGVVSAKCDVYSYGMMVLEMVGGRRNAKQSAENSSQVYFPHWLYDRLVEDGQVESCDVAIVTDEVARKMGIVGLWCTQIMPVHRPSMSRVVEMLERGLDELEMPPKQSFSSPPHLTILSTSSSILS